MENYVTSKRAPSDKKRDFINDVNRAKIAILTFLNSRKIRPKLKLSKTNFILRKKDSIGVSCGGFWLYEGRNTGKNRIADFDFFPDARVHVQIYYPRPNGSVLNVVSLEQVSDLKKVISSYMEMIVCVYKNKQRKKKTTILKTGHH